MEDEGMKAGFAPADPSDGRKPGEWQTRYSDKSAKWGIRFEAAYIVLLLFLCPTALLVLWIREDQTFCGLSEKQVGVVCRYAYAWAGGVLGGTLFTLKWLYHSVARWMWNRDRRLWRLCAPHLSGALAFVFVCMINSGMLVIFDKDAMRRPSVIVAIAFLVGYFSDSALAKMSEIAMSLFGTAGKGLQRS
jgi:hypothetical protein